MSPALWWTSPMPALQTVRERFQIDHLRTTMIILIDNVAVPVGGHQCQLGGAQTGVQTFRKRQVSIQNCVAVLFEDSSFQIHILECWGPGLVYWQGSIPDQVKVATIMVKLVMMLRMMMRPTMILL